MDEAAGALIDIVQPVMPPVAETAMPVLPALIVCVVLLLAGVVAWRRWRKSGRRAQKRILKLRNDYQSGRLDARAAVYLLAAELQRALQLNPLAPAQLPQAMSATDIPAWKSFVSRLSSLRYEPQSGNGVQDIAPLFDQANVWLRRYSC